MDITDQQRMTQELWRKEAYLADAQRLSHTGSFGWSVSSGEVFWSEETFRIFEYAQAAKPSAELVLQRVHPEFSITCPRSFTRFLVSTRLKSAQRSRTI